jgi:hypothetical protein
MDITVNTENMREVGDNILAKEVNGLLVLVIDPKVNGHMSGSGKMVLKASTGGFSNLPCGLRGNINIGVNSRDL